MRSGLSFLPWHSGRRYDVISVSVLSKEHGRSDRSLPNGPGPVGGLSCQYRRKASPPGARKTGGRVVHNVTSGVAW
jgi:hypothetical protein